MSQFKVSYKRHLAKTISYRIISTLIGFLIMWWATGNIKFGAAFGIAELVYKPIQYYIHERIWYRFLKFGLVEEKRKKTQVEPKTKPVEFPIEESEIKKPKKGKRLSYSKKAV
jgi:uncharacterized membrane protein